MTAESNSGDDRLSRRISGVADSERKRQYTAALGGRNLRGDAYAARQRRRSGGYVERNHRGVDYDRRGQSVDISRVSRASLLGKALRAPLAFIPKAAVVRVLQGPLAGRRWIVGSATHGAWLGTYEYRKQRLFALSIQPGMVVFDLGANVGFYTLVAAVRTGERGRVYAFEPVPRNLGFLRRHLGHNRVRNVEIVEAAVSNASGVAAFEDFGDPSM